MYSKEDLLKFTKLRNDAELHNNLQFQKDMLECNIENLGELTVFEEYGAKAYKWATPYGIVIEHANHRMELLDEEPKEETLEYEEFKIRVGSKVILRPCFGIGEPMEAVVTGLGYKNEKSLFDYNTKSNNPLAGSWAYMTQLDKVIEY